MASELEFVKYKDFVEGLSEAAEFASSDKSVVSNSTDGPRSIPAYSLAKLLEKINFSFGDYELLHGTINNEGATLGSFTSSESYRSVKVPCSKGDIFWICGDGTSYRHLWTTQNEVDVIMRRSGKSLVKEENEYYLVTIQENETSICFNTATSANGFIKYVNVGNLAKVLGAKTLDDIHNIYGEKVVSGRYVAAGTSGFLGIRYKPNTTEVQVKLVKRTWEYNTFAIYAEDSTNQNSTKMLDNGCTCDTLYKVSLPSGYDTIYFYSSRPATTNGIDIDVVEIVESSLAERLKKVEDTAYSDGWDKVSTFQKSSGASERLSFYYTPDTPKITFRLERTNFEFSLYELYANDSTNANPVLLLNSALDFGQMYEFELPQGYDRFMFFKTAYTTLGIDVSLYVAREQSLGFRVYDLEEFEKPFFKDKKIICFGDSITEFKHDGKSYPDWLARFSLANVINGGIGGTRYAPRHTPTATPSSSAEAYGNLDIYNLIHAWCVNDWTYADAANQWFSDNNQGTYTSVINRLKGNPIANAEVIILFAGTNDYTSATPLGTSGSEDISTACGAMTKCVNELLSTNPGLKIFIMTPIVRYVGEITDEKYSDVYTRGDGLTLRQFAKGLFDAATEIHIPVCDLYNTLGWNKWNFNYYFDGDTTHPGTGYDSLAKKIYSFLLANNF